MALTSGYLLNTDLSDWALEEETSIILFSCALLIQVVKRGCCFWCLFFPEMTKEYYNLYSGEKNRKSEEVIWYLPSYLWNGQICRATKYNSKVFVVLFWGIIYDIDMEIEGTLGSVNETYKSCAQNMLCIE